MLAENCLRIAQDVHWRTFSDGVVVYVAETCETHLLLPHWAGFFASADLAAPLDVANRSAESGFSGEDTKLFANEMDSALQALVDLKILDRVN